MRCKQFGVFLQIKLIKFLLPINYKIATYKIVFVGSYLNGELVLMSKNRRKFIFIHLFTNFDKSNCFENT